MKIVSSPDAIRRLSAGLVRSGQRVGLVPTMGALHDGHLALIRRARRECQRVIVTIYVNPTQFGPNEDLTRYPRPRRRDLALCRRAGVDVVFAPQNLYLPDHSTYVEETSLSRGREGASRPGHFRGVATVVLMLFNLARPTHAYFGQKDAQQVEVIRRMVRDLYVPVQIVVVPTVRDPDGLALSSRNRYLSPKERSVAVEFARLLQAASRRPADSARWLRKQLQSVPGLKMDYVELAGNRLCAAVVIGKTRLIDNRLLDIFDLPHYWCWTVQTMSGLNVTLIFTWNLPWKKKTDTGLGELTGEANITGQVYNKDRGVKALRKRIDDYKAKAKGKKISWHLKVSESGLGYTIWVEGMPELRVVLMKGFRGFLYEGSEKIGRIQLFPDEDKENQRRS